MTRDEILTALNAEIYQLTSVRNLLAGQSSNKPEITQKGRKAQGVVKPEASAPTRRGGMSAEGKARVAEAQRNRWAKLKRESAKAARAAVAKKSAPPAKASSKAATKKATSAAPAKKAPNKKAVRPSLKKAAKKSPSKAVAAPTPAATPNE